MKTAGVDEAILTFTGKARVYESQDAAVAGILVNEVEPGCVVVIRYEGPKGGPGMQEMLYPTSYLKSRAGQGLRLADGWPVLRRQLRSSRSAMSRRKRPGGLARWSRRAYDLLIDIPNRTIRSTSTMPRSPAGRRWRQCRRRQQQRS